METALQMLGAGYVTISPGSRPDDTEQQLGGALHGVAGQVGSPYAALKTVTGVLCAAVIRAFPARVIGSK